MEEEDGIIVRFTLPLKEEPPKKPETCSWSTKLLRIVRNTPRWVNRTYWRRMAVHDVAIIVLANFIIAVSISYLFSAPRPCLLTVFDLRRYLAKCDGLLGSLDRSTPYHFQRVSLSKEGLCVWYVDLDSIRYTFEQRFDCFVLTGPSGTTVLTDIHEMMLIRRAFFERFFARPDTVIRHLELRSYDSFMNLNGYLPKRIETLRIQGDGELTASFQQLAETDIDHIEIDANIEPLKLQPFAKSTSKSLHICNPTTPSALLAARTALLKVSEKAYTYECAKGYCEKMVLDDLPVGSFYHSEALFYKDKFQRTRRIEGHFADDNRRLRQWLEQRFEAKETMVEGRMSMTIAIPGGGKEMNVIFDPYSTSEGRFCHVTVAVMSEASAVERTLFSRLKFAIQAF